MDPSLHPLAHKPNLNATLIHTFIALQLSGASIFLFILVLALLCRTRINRRPVWYNFCVSWVVFGVSFSLLTLCGEQFKIEPRKRVCLVQAGLVYAAPFLFVCSMFLLQAWVDLLRMQGFLVFAWTCHSSRCSNCLLWHISPK